MLITIFTQFALHSVSTYFYENDLRPMANVRRIMAKVNRLTHYKEQKVESSACYADIAGKMRENRSRQFKHIREQK